MDLRSLPVALPSLAAMPRQHHLLTQILPALLHDKVCSAIWLSGSLARGDADRWSNVNLHLLVATEALSRCYDWVAELMDHHIEQGWTCFSCSETRVSGITWVVDPADATRGAAHFSIDWIDAVQLPAHLEHHRPWRLLFAAEDLPASVRQLLESNASPFLSPDHNAIAIALTHFWELLSRLPAALNRREWLAAAHLLHSARQTLTDLVVALNGASRPLTSARVNRYLGPAQLEAFEKTLPIRQVEASAWVGQAVALIVLYRWYAPQLVDLYTVHYPAELERTTLALLSAEVDGWPALIQTG